MKISLVVFLIFSFFIDAYGQQPKLVLPIGHSKPLDEILFSKDGKTVMAAGMDNMVTLWDRNKDRLLYSINDVKHLDFSPDAESMIIVDGKNQCSLYDIRKGVVRFSFGTGNEGIRTAKFSHTGKYVLCIIAGDSIQYKIWDARSGSLVQAFAFEPDQLLEGVDQYSADFSPDDRLIVLPSSIESIARVVETKTGRVQWTLRGHNSFISTQQFSPDGSFILTSALDGTMKVWDPASGKLVHTLPIGKTLKWYKTIFSPDSKYILSYSVFLSDSVKVWERLTGKLLFNLCEFKPLSLSRIEPLFSPDSKFILHETDKEYGEIIEIKSGTVTGIIKEFFINPDNKLYTVAVSKANFSPDSKSIVTANQFNSLRKWNLRGELLHTYDSFNTKNRSLKIELLRFGADDKNLNAVNSDGSLITWDPLSGKKIGTTHLIGHVAGFTNAEFSREGELIVSTSRLSYTRIWHVPTGKQIGINLNDSAFNPVAKLSPDNRYVATLTPGQILIWETAGGRLLQTIKLGSNEIWEYMALVDDKFCFSPDSKFILVATWDGFVRRYNCTTGECVSTLWHPRAATMVKFDPSGNYFMTIAGDSTMRIWQYKDDSLAWSYRGEEVIGTSQYSADGNYALSSGGGISMLWDLRTHTFVKAFPYLWRDPQFSEDSKLVLYSNGINSYIWDIETAKKLDSIRQPKVLSTYFQAQFIPGGKRLMSSFGDTTYMWDLRTGAFERSIFFPTGGNQFVFDNKAKLFLFNTTTELQLYNADDFRPLCKFIGIDSLDYLTLSPEGYYQCSSNAAKLLHYYTREGKVLSFEQLDVKYNRPDKILEAIGNTDTALIRSYHKAWEKRIRKLGIDTTAFRSGYSVPECDFVDRGKIGNSQTNGKIQLHINGMDNTYKLERFNIWVNEVPLFGQRGISLLGRNANSFDTTLIINLSQDENQLETSIINVNGTESYREPLQVSYKPAARQKEITHFIGIGIDRFADKQYDLQYSSKDIRDLALKLKEKYGNGITIDTLFNRDVTVANVKALKKKLELSGINDKVIISYSGHGLLSKDFDYFLSTYTVNFEKPEENGLPYDALEDLLDNIPARKKLMLIDACHSGEVDKEELVRINSAPDSLHLEKGIKPVAYEGTQSHLGMKNSFELMQSLFVNVGKSTGATIISAAAGTQFALERGDLQNGVFTYCILEAMEKNKTMKISELKKIVGERVEQLTNGLQQPTSRNENISVDWTLW